MEAQPFFLWGKTDKVVGLPVARDANVEFVVLEFQLIVERLQHGEEFICEGQGGFGCPFLPVGPVRYGLYFLVLTYQPQAQLVQYPREYQRHLVSNPEGTELE